MTPTPELLQLRDYYAAGHEADRLQQRSISATVEATRVQSLLARLLPAGCTVADIGGGTGVHAAWLAARGHAVTLVDLIDTHVHAASQHSGVTALLADARALPLATASQQATLLFGPLYHLGHAADRQRALAEAVRITRPGGLVFVSALSRLGAIVDAVLATDFCPPDAPGLLELITTGTRRAGVRPAGAGFPAAHFHTAEELLGDCQQAGLRDVQVIGLEGPASFAAETLPPHPRGHGAAALLADYEVRADYSNHLCAVGYVSAVPQR